MITDFLFSHQLLMNLFLLGGDILATFAVAYGIVLETPAAPNEREKRAVRFVIIGVMFEAIFSIGLFAFDEAVMASQGSDIQTLSRLTKEATDAASKAKTDASAASAVANSAETSAATALGDARDAEKRLGLLETSEKSLEHSLNHDEERIANRTITKRQYEVIASLLGKISAINYSWQSDCLECSQYASQIMFPLLQNQDKVSIKEYPLPGYPMTGVVLISKGPQDSDVIYLTLKRAGLNPLWMPAATSLPFAQFPHDVPLLFVGERFGWYRKLPYFPAPKK